MNGYSKMRVSSIPTSKSRSVDLSDLTFSPPHPHGRPDPNFVAQEAHGHLPWVEEEVAGGERFGVILNRNCCSASQRFRGGERGHGGTTTLKAVARAFSMRTPSLAAEAYGRIHDTGDCETEPPQQQQMRPSTKKRGKIFRACKRLFGL